MAIFRFNWWKDSEAVHCINSFPKRSHCLCGFCGVTQAGLCCYFILVWICGHIVARAWFSDNSNYYLLSFFQVQFSGAVRLLVVEPGFLKGGGSGCCLGEPGVEGRLCSPEGWEQTQHFIQEWGVNSSFPAVNLEVMLKCLADASVWCWGF